jgi:hypothetical protein
MSKKSKRVAKRDRANVSGAALIPYEHLAAMTGQTVAQVRKAVGELHADGWLNAAEIDGRFVMAETTVPGSFKRAI